MSVMNPSRPWLMPISGTRNGASSRAMPSIVPSPPSTIATSACLPIACTVWRSTSSSPTLLGRGEVEQHAGTGGLDDAGDCQQRLAYVFRARLAEDGDIAEGLGHRIDYAGGAHRPDDLDDRAHLEPWQPS